MPHGVTSGARASDQRMFFDRQQGRAADAPDRTALR